MRHNSILQAHGNTSASKQLSSTHYLVYSHPAHVFTWHTNTEQTLTLLRNGCKVQEANIARRLYKPALISTLPRYRTKQTPHISKAAARSMLYCALAAPAACANHTGHQTTSWLERVKS
jgi:hypothetical protein